MSVQGVVELWPVDPFVQFILFGDGPAQSVATINDPHAAHVIFSSLGKARLETKRRHCTGDGGGGRSGAVAPGTLELCQGRGHPAAVRVAQYQTFLGAGLRGLSQSFLQVHFDGCKKESIKNQQLISHIRT